MSILVPCLDYDAMTLEAPGVDAEHLCLGEEKEWRTARRAGGGAEAADGGAARCARIWWKFPVLTLVRFMRKKYGEPKIGRTFTFISSALAVSREAT